MTDQGNPRRHMVWIDELRIAIVIFLCTAPIGLIFAAIGAFKSFICKIKNSWCEAHKQFQFQRSRLTCTSFSTLNNCKFHSADHLWLARVVWTDCWWASRTTQQEAHKVRTCRAFIEQISEFDCPWSHKYRRKAILLSEKSCFLDIFTHSSNVSAEANEACLYQWPAWPGPGIQIPKLVQAG